MLVFCSVILFVGLSRSGAEDCVLPTLGGTQQDRYSSFFDSDQYAWKLFLALNRQADPKMPGVPDAKYPDLTRYDNDTPVVWESWALSSGGRSGPFRRTRPNRSEVFLDAGAQPAEWGKWPRKAASDKSLEHFQGEDPLNLPTTSQPTIVNCGGVIHILVDDSVAGTEQIGEEVRMNRCTYEFIRQNELYNVEGVEKKALEAIGNGRTTVTSPIDFPVTSQLIKAKWIRIEENQKPRYHWRTIKVQTKDGEETQVWGLVGLHIITKDIPNWFWCSFEQVDTETTAEISSRDVTTRGQSASSGSNGVRNETKGSKWENYRLRGTQIDFTSSSGPFILANSQVEHGFQMSSSCMTCHARATIGLRAQRPDLPAWQVNSLPVFTAVFNDNLVPANVNADTLPELIRYGAVGAPDPEWYRIDKVRLRYIQSDFLWSLAFRPYSKTAVPPGGW
jgi:hypothetical protein